MRFGAIISLILIAAATGCVSKAQYESLKTRCDELNVSLSQAEAKAQDAQKTADMLRQQLANIEQSGDNSKALAAKYQRELNELGALYTALQAKYNELASRPATVIGQLPKEVNDALEALARAHSDIIEFDSARGVVKFKSDLTFASGSAELTSGAKDVIKRFAGVLNGPASDFELQIVGHTDNDPVKKITTIQAGHKDNWFLSAHRAISVSDALQGDRVSPKRITVAGRGEQEPIDSNATDTGKKKNRRVEVMILSKTVKAGVGTGRTAPVGPVTPPNKDSGTSVKPPINKN